MFTVGLAIDLLIIVEQCVSVILKIFAVHICVLTGHLWISFGDNPVIICSVNCLQSVEQSHEYTFSPFQDEDN